ncbi:hypothetical protein JHK82_053170 [Glycine max]|nr:hypothetical protein JHK82_053170 [Glycine max]
MRRFSFSSFSSIRFSLTTAPFPSPLSTAAVDAGTRSTDTASRGVVLEIRWELGFPAGDGGSRRKSAAEKRHAPAAAMAAGDSNVSSV